MNQEDKWLTVAVALLTVSVLVTGSLAVYLTVALEEEPQDESVATESVGQRIVYSTDQRGSVDVNVMDIETGNVTQVSGAEFGFAWDPSWSPGGDRVAYWGAQDIPFGQDAVLAEVRVVALGSEESILVSGGIERPFSVTPAWSPDGSRLTVVGAAEQTDDDVFHSTIYIVRADGSGIESSITLQGTVYWIQWSPVGDDLLLALETSDDNVGVYIWSDEAQELTVVAPAARVADWMPNGEGVMVGDNSAQAVTLVNADMETSVVAQFASFPFDVAVSPNGDYVALGSALAPQQGVATSLQIIEVDTGEVTTIVDNQDYLFGPDWSADGSQLVFTWMERRRRPDSNLPYASLWMYDVGSGGLERLTPEDIFSGLGMWAP